MPNRNWLAFEAALLFLLLPMLVATLAVRGLIFGLLWTAALYCYLQLRLDPSFDDSRLWGFVFPQQWRLLLLRFVLAALAISVFVVLLDSTKLFSFVRTRPRLWAVVMLLYPILSVIPQGLVYRVFFIHRYRDWLSTPRLRILLSAIAFSFAHIVFRNPWAILFTFVGGLMFASTYLKTRSNLAASVEHALYGCFVFTIGIGQYFYAGPIR
ncbi:MAG TPA: CPBP family intramembrane glutamic endopeptidase [Bryobacteraceae bacterium]|nr:CPBP family intramembrane glutamic endopeptidase [Bryobacteraceae bacterium]